MLLLKDNEQIAVKIFGHHNQQNIQGAKLICRELGISDSMFYKAIQTFEGANKRLQQIFTSESDMFDVFLDFAHAPSKVRATINAVRVMFPNRKLIACLELHTYSSLRKDFLPQYSNTMNDCDVPIVYFNPHAVELKRLPMLTPHDIQEGFNVPNLKIFSNSRQLFDFITSSIIKNSVVLLMSSGNFDNFDIKNWIKSIRL